MEQYHGLKLFFYYGVVLITIVFYHLSDDQTSPGPDDVLGAD